MTWRATRAVLVVAAVLLVAAAGLRLNSVHHRDWDWSLVRSATPSKIHVNDRDYVRGRPTDDTAGCADLAPAGETGGGATILALPDVGVSTLICVVDGDETWLYGLLGGP